MNMIQLVLADPRVEQVADERDGGDGIWVYTKPGFHDGYDKLGPTHGIHEDTWGAVLKQMKRIEPCECKDCRAGQRRTS